MTTFSQWISPAAVTTEAMRPPLTVMPVTAESSKMRAPRSLAPRAKATARSVGLMRPSLGIQTPPTMPFSLTMGSFSTTCFGFRYSISSPRARPRAGKPR